MFHETVQANQRISVGLASVFIYIFKRMRDSVKILSEGLGMCSTYGVTMDYVKHRRTLVYSSSSFCLKENIALNRFFNNLYESGMKGEGEQKYSRQIH